ncbi:1278_t:CDS:2, partial [Racocetra fulgida]
TAKNYYQQSYVHDKIPVSQSGFDVELLSNVKFNSDDLIREFVKKIIPNHGLKENCTEGIELVPEIEDVLIPLAEIYYDKFRSFFDNIPCETKKHLGQGLDGRQKQSKEKHLNIETFGRGPNVDGRNCGDYRNCDSRRG